VKKRWILVAVAAVLLPAGIAAAASTHSTVKLSGKQSVTVTCSGKSLTVVPSATSATLTCVPKAKATKPATAAAPTTAPPPTTPPAPALTPQQKNAVQAAKNYLNTEPGFSQQGLIDQLDSPDGSGFSVADATAAVDSLGVDWNAQAVDAAKNYNSSEGGFSCSGMIQQLDSPDGSQFTVAQATYGATQAGNC
jgi:hypothetical protein